MNPKLLIPHRYKRIGWCILIPAAITGLILMIKDYDGFHFNAKVVALLSDQSLGNYRFFRFIETDISDTLAGTLFITGALLVAFSKERNEDEYIAGLRLSSLLWAVLVNYVLLLFAFLFVYGVAFIDVMLYNMFTILVIFIARFNYVLYRNSKLKPDEKYH